ncbi:MAG: nucleotidyltransferase domain-containing protein [Holophagales bacterium]|jgi:predicted nucleotidyltransferase|nr:nucleotidyltransferase domain-containing protein [Holophagales bacterium]
MKYTDEGIYQRPHDIRRLLTHDEICDAIRKVADEYALTKVEYFGSYADGRATEGSDLDILVEFVERSVSVLRIIGLQQSLEEIFNVAVDVIHAPIPEDSFLEIGNTVVAYENQR